MIISIVEQLVAQLDVPANINAVESNITFGFNHGGSHWQNLLNDEYDFGDFDGVVFLDQPITTEYQLTAGGYIGEFYPVTLFFMMKSELEYTPQEHEANCIEPANDAVRQFISICQSRGDLVDEISDPTALEFTNLLDVNVSGKSLSIKIKPYINKSVCVPGFLPVCAPAKILDSDGVTFFDVVSGGNGTCTPVSLINISNSNDSYSVDTLVNLELPNIDFTDSNGITTSVASMENIEATPCEVKAGIAYPSIPYSGNLVSFNNYDEAWQMLNGVLDRTNPTNPTHLAELDYTSLTPFFTLKQNNKYGNLDRITDDLGTQIYANNLIVDNLYNIMYWQIGLPLDTQTNHLITANASTNGGFADWNLASKAILESIRNHGLANGNSLVQPIFQTSSIMYTSTRTPAGTLVQYITSAGTTLQQATTFLWSGLLWRKLTD